MASDSAPERPTLAEVFAPPDEHRQGIFGVACALSAEAPFLEMALERFTGLTPRARGRVGQVALALLTDAHQPNLGINAPSGLYHAFSEQQGRWPRRVALMHAKVAILSFGPARAGVPDLLRLVVSTGNWTMLTASRSIDLVWTCDLPVNPHIRKEVWQEAADIRAAAGFFRILLGTVNNPGFYRMDAPIRKRVEALLSRCEVVAETVLGTRKTPRARFVSTFSAAPKKYAFGASRRSLGSQVIHRFASDKVKRNFIVVGSGFFENPKSGGAGCPRVLTELCDELQAVGVLSQELNEKNRMLVANPSTAGAVARWLHNTAPGERGWCPCKFNHPDREGVTLHAKYVFVANAWSNYNRYTRGLLYLGSGNLSWQGFAMAPLEEGERGAPGNVEAGVAIAVNIRHWNILCKLLGIDGDHDFESSDFDPDSEGEEEIHSEPVKRPPPLLGATWRADTMLLELRWATAAADDNPTGCCLIWGSTRLEVEYGVHDVQVHGDAPPPPRIVMEQGEERWTVLLFSEDGDFCRPLPRPRLFDDVLAQLFDFPSQTSDVDDDDPPEPGDPPDEDGNESGGGGDGMDEDPLKDLAHERRRYPIRRAMELLETIADRNQCLTPGLLPDWVAHLRRLLLEELDRGAVAAMGELKLNFLAPLLDEPGFAPPDANTDYRVFIEELMDRWGLGDHPRLIPEKEE